MNLLHKMLYAIGLGGAVMVVGCTNTTPQENYARYIQRHIGENIDSSTSFGSRRISERLLENGNIEYRYSYAGGQCIETYEVDSKTRVILSASYAGSDDACQLSP